MQGPFQWVRQKVGSIYKSAKSVIAVTGEMLSTVGSYLQAGSFSVGVANWVDQACQGALRVLNFPAIISITFMTRPKTWGVLWRGQLTNVWRLAQVLLLRYGVPYAGRYLREISRPLLPPVLSATITDNSWGEFAIVHAWDAATSLYLVRNLVRGYADNAAFNMAMAKVSVVETEPPKIAAKKTGDGKQEQMRNPMVENCKCDSQKITLALGYSPLYYWGTWITMDMSLAWFAQTIPYGAVALAPLQMLFYGRTLLEYPLAAAGNCMEHRLEAQNKNLPTTMGVGGSYLGLYWLTQLGIWVMDAPSSYLVNEALLAMLFLYFNMATNLSRNLPLPGATVGVDPFYHHRKLTDSVAQESVGFMRWLFQGPQEGDWYQNIKTSVLAKWKHPAAHAVRALIMDENLRDWEKLKKRYSSRVYLEHCGKDLRNAIIEVQKIRKDAFYQWVNYFQGVLPSIKATERDMLSKVMAEELEVPLNDWLRYIDDAIEHNADEDKPEESRMPARPSVSGMWSGAERRRPVPRVDNANEEAGKRLSMSSTLN